MTYFEFHAGISVFKINDPQFMKNIRGKNTPVYIWQNNKIYYNQAFSAIIEGNIPLEVINSIYHKYPGHQSNIRLHNNNWIDNLDELTIDNKYMKYCYIDTLEDFVIFLAEMGAYFTHQYNYSETVVPKYRDFMAMIYSDMLQEANPYSSTENWICCNGNNQEFFNTNMNGTQTPFGKLLRHTLEEFDIAVNPYMNPDIELDSIATYLEKVRININGPIPSITSKQDNFCSIDITDIKSNNRVHYSRLSNELSYCLYYTLDNGSRLSISHIFSTTLNGKKTDSEEIYIGIVNETNAYTVGYHLTSDMIEYDQGEKEIKRPITEDIRNWLIAKLLEAVPLAASITLANMETASKAKSLN